MSKVTDKQIDKKLNIKTRGVRKPIHSLHSRYEGTPYSDLLLLFDLIKLNKDDHLIDFGSGKGRVCFLAHHLFNCYTTGIEINSYTYDEAIDNLHTYYENIDEDNKISFVLTKAESYQIENNHNVFFFFNPFDVTLFKQVISNITKSIIFNPREIKIILAYPFTEYVSYLLEHTDFIIIDVIEANLKKDPTNKFLILSN